MASFIGSSLILQSPAQKYKNDTIVKNVSLLTDTHLA